jgi:hypothetical protein
VIISEGALHPTTSQSSFVLDVIHMTLHHILLLAQTRHMQWQLPNPVGFTKVRRVILGPDAQAYNQKLEKLMTEPLENVTYHFRRAGDKW